jgi:hypothetical protein
MVVHIYCNTSTWEAEARVNWCAFKIDNINIEEMEKTDLEN